MILYLNVGYLQEANLCSNLLKYIFAILFRFIEKFVIFVNMHSIDVDVTGLNYSTLSSVIKILIIMQCKILSKEFKLISNTLSLKRAAYYRILTI